MILNRTIIEEFESIIAFYNDVTDRTPEMENTGWKDFYFFELKQ
jgi:hypothetical protein